MFILIVGQGKVGSTLAAQLSAEGHDLVLIDTNSAVLQHLQETLDVATLCGNGAAADVLLEAGADRADLLIACTNGDEVNLLSCMVAKKLGTENTIARVRNPEYDFDLRLLKDELHVSLVINPELTAAREIYRNLQFPTFMKRDTFVRGKADLVELRIGKDSPLNGLRLADLPKITKEKALICAVEREGQLTIPHGSFVLHQEDKIIIAAVASGLVRFIKDLGLPPTRIRRVMIIGGSRTAIHVAKMLMKSRVQVTIMENNAQRARELTLEVPEATVLFGNGTFQDVLVSEGIRDVDAVLALTGIDEENVIISMFANYMGVPKTVTKIARTEFMDVFTQAGLDSIVSPKLLTANEIIRYVRAMSSSAGQSMIALSRIMDSKAEAMEFIVPGNAPYVGIPFKNLTMQPNTIVAAIARGRDVIIPSGGDMLLGEDRVVVITGRDKSIGGLEEIFRGGVQ